MNKIDLRLKRFIINTIDFIIQLNNSIAKRKKEHNIEDIKKLYNIPINNDIYTYYEKTISEMFEDVKDKGLTNLIEKEIFSHTFDITKKESAIVFDEILKKDTIKIDISLIFGTYYKNTS